MNKYEAQRKEAYSAAWSAAWSAESAAESAWSAAESAARSAESAESADAEEEILQWQIDAVLEVL